MFKKSLFTKSNPLLLAKQLSTKAQQQLQKAAAVPSITTSQQQQQGNQQARFFHTNTTLLRDHVKGRQRRRFLLKVTNYLRPNMRRRKRSLGNINYNRKQAGIQLNQNTDPIEAEAAEIEEEIAATEITLKNLIEVDEDEILEAAKTLPAAENTFVQFVDAWIESGRDPNAIFNMSPDEMEQFFDPEDALVYIAQLPVEDQEDLHAQMSFKLYPYLEVLNQFEVIDNDEFIDEEASILNLGDPQYNFEEIQALADETIKEYDETYGDADINSDAAPTEHQLNLGEAAADAKKALLEEKDDEADKDENEEPLLKSAVDSMSKQIPADQRPAINSLTVGDLERIFEQVTLELENPELAEKFAKLDEALLELAKKNENEEVDDATLQAALDVAKEEEALKLALEEDDGIAEETEADKIEAKKAAGMVKATKFGEDVEDFEEEGAEEEKEDVAFAALNKNLSELEQYAAEYDIYDELDSHLDDLEIESAVEDFMEEFEENMDETDNADIKTFEKLLIEKGVDPALLKEDVQDDAEKLLRTDIAKEFELSQEDCDDILADAGLNIDEDAIMKSVENLFDIGFFESTPQMKAARKRVEAARAVYVSAKQREEMWSLHKSNPEYWTGERLARSFGTSRNNAWHILLTKEEAEAKATNKPFSAEKAGVIFEKEINKALGHKKHLPKIDKGLLSNSININNVKSEADVYKQFLQKSIEADYTAGHDDSLPEWVKRPFQLSPTQQVTPQQVSGVKRVATHNPIPSHGTLTSKYPIMITEMSRHVKHTNLNDRAYLVKEIDGTLRTASEEEKKYMLRRGPHVKQTKWGLGGKLKRKSFFRQRKIEKLKV